jgi:hypothetical protein
MTSRNFCRIPEVSYKVVVTIYDLVNKAAGCLDYRVINSGVINA